MIFLYHSVFKEKKAWYLEFFGLVDIAAQSLTLTYHARSTNASSAVFNMMFSIIPSIVRQFIPTPVLQRISLFFFSKRWEITGVWWNDVSVTIDAIW
jgi:hypothetical protein